MSLFYVDDIFISQRVVLKLLHKNTVELPFYGIDHKHQKSLVIIQMQVTIELLEMLKFSLNSRFFGPKDIQPPCAKFFYIFSFIFKT